MFSFISSSISVGIINIDDDLLRGWCLISSIYSILIERVVSTENLLVLFLYFISSLEAWIGKVKENFDPF
jgi:hypothetical protein